MGTLARPGWDMGVAQGWGNLSPWRWGGLGTQGTLVTHGSSLGTWGPMLPWWGRRDLCHASVGTQRLLSLRWGHPGDTGPLLAQSTELGTWGPCHPELQGCPMHTGDQVVPMSPGGGAQGRPGAPGTMGGLGSTGGFMDRERSRGWGPQGVPPGVHVPPIECMRVSPRPSPGGLAGAPPSDRLSARGRRGGGGLSGGTSKRRRVPHGGAGGLPENGAPGCTRLVAGGVTGQPDPPGPCSRCSSSSSAAFWGGPGPGGSGHPSRVRWPRRGSVTRCGGVTSGVGSSGVSRSAPGSPWGGSSG